MHGPPLERARGSKRRRRRRQRCGGGGGRAAERSVRPWTDLARSRVSRGGRGRFTFTFIRCATRSRAVPSLACEYQLRRAGGQSNRQPTQSDSACCSQHEPANAASARYGYGNELSPNCLRRILSAVQMCRRRECRLCISAAASASKPVTAPCVCASALDYYTYYSASCPVVSIQLVGPPAVLLLLYRIRRNVATSRSVKGKPTTDQPSAAAFRALFQFTMLQLLYF